MKADLPAGFDLKVQQGVRRDARRCSTEVHTPRHRQPDLHGPDGGRGRAVRAETIAWGITGPLLPRGRRAATTSARRSPTGPTTASSSRCRSGKNGDNFDRYLVRMAEMEQSMRIAEQALDALPGGPIQRGLRGQAHRPGRLRRPGQAGQDRGPAAGARSSSRRISQGQGRAAQRRVNVHDKRVVLPPKETAYGSIEGLMNHFMLVMDGYGIRPPAGEAYVPVEGANGELGFYVVSGRD